MQVGLRDSVREVLERAVLHVERRTTAVVHAEHAVYADKRDAMQQKVLLGDRRAGAFPALAVYAPEGPHENGDGVGGQTVELVQHQYQRFNEVFASKDIGKVVHLVDRRGAQAQRFGDVSTIPSTLGDPLAINK